MDDPKKDPKNKKNKSLKKYYSTYTENNICSKIRLERIKKKSIPSRKQYNTLN